MATTASLLKAGPVFMSWKHHQQFCSRQISSNNNFFSLKMKSDRLNIRNPTELRLVRVSSSNLRSELSRNYSKAGSSNLHDLNKLVCSSYNHFDVGSMSVVDKLSRNLLAGLLLMAMALALALRSRDSAFAASSSHLLSLCDSNSLCDSDSDSCCRPKGGSGAGDAAAFFWLVALVLLFFMCKIYYLKICTERSVLKLQVGILDKKRVLQRKLNRITESADTSTSRGLSQLLQEVSNALLQHHDSCHFVYYLEEREDFDDFLQNSFKPFYRRLKIRERKRYDRETFMNVDGVKLERSSAKYSVVTFLVLARGRYATPFSVRSALETLYSIPSEQIKEVAVFRSDTVSKQELRRSFPYIISCYDEEKRIPQEKWWKGLLAKLGM